MLVGIPRSDAYTFRVAHDPPGAPFPEKGDMNDNLRNITRTLQALLKALPAIRQHSSAETVGRHVALIAHFQGRYDRLASATRLRG